MVVAFGERVVKRIIRRLPFSPVVLYRIAIILGLLAIEVALGRMMVKFEKPEFIVAACVMPVTVFLLYQLGRIEYGVLAIVFTAAVVRFTLPTGTQSRLVMSLLVTAVFIVIWIARMLVIERRVYLLPSSVNVPLLGYVVTCIVSLVWSNAFRDVLVVVWSTWPFVQMGGLAVMILLPGALLLTYNSFKEVKWLHWLVALFLIVGAVSIGGQFAHLPVRFLQVRPLFPTWVICLAYALALFDRRLPGWLRVALLLLAAAWFYQVFVRQFIWLSAWMPTVVAIGVISLFKSKYFLILIILALVVYGILNFAMLQADFETERAVSGDTRLDAYIHNWRVTGKHLLFGVGPAGYAVYYMSYFPDEAMATHSTYLDTLSQTGIVGLFFLLWTFFELGRTAWKLVWRLRGGGNFEEAFSVSALAGIAGVIVAMGLGDWIMPFVYTQTIAGFDYAAYTWVLMGAMLSLNHITAPAAGERA